LSVQYATASELASYLEQDVDTSTATLALQVASALFSTRADTMFAATTVTYQAPATGYRWVQLPFRPITAISAVRVITSTGVTTTLTDYTRIKRTLYRVGGFGTPGAFPPDLLEVDLTHGLVPCPDDVKGAVLETAGAAYSSPDVTVKSESIDDYTVSSAANSGGVMLTPAAKDLADLYRGTFAA
jgi:hypothetical protein